METASCFRKILSGAGTENRVVFPLNLYVGLALLAECLAGETQAEILALPIQRVH